MFLFPQGCSLPGVDDVETLTALAGGFAVALTPQNLLWSLAGVTLGTAIGVLPGIGPALTVALLLPVTYSLDPTAAFIMFAGIYYGGMYGGSTTSILLNTPGESASVMSAVEGNLMARAGRGGAALATAAIGSFVAGTLGTAALTVCAPVMVEFALRFGPAEYFALAVLAFVAVSAMLGESRLGGFASLLFGLLLGMIGIDPLTGVPRLTLGVPQLFDGIDVVVVAVGLFAVGEVLYRASRYHLDPEIVVLRGSRWMTREEWARSWKAWLRGAAIGFPLGALPAGGAEIPTFLSYAVERRLARDPNEFGRGAIEGVAGPEAANNAAAAGTLVPLLALGLPTSATAAIMLAAFQQYRTAARPAPVPARATARLGTDRELVCRQRDAARAQPAVGRALGAAAHHPAPGALQCDSDSGERRRVQREPLCVRRRPAVRDRRRRLPDAVPLHPACTGDHRRDSRTDGRTAIAPRSGDCRRVSSGARHPADLVGIARSSAAAVGGTSNRPLVAPLMLRRTTPRCRRARPVSLCGANGSRMHDLPRLGSSARLT